MTREHITWHNMKNEHGQCSWGVTGDGMLMVRTHLGTKCTQLGGSSPDMLARVLIKEISLDNGGWDCEYC